MNNNIKKKLQAVVVDVVVWIVVSVVLTNNVDWIGEVSGKGKLEVNAF